MPVKTRPKIPFFILISGILMILIGFLLKIFDYPRNLSVAFSGLLLCLLALVLLVFPPKPGV